MLKINIVFYESGVEAAALHQALVAALTMGLVGREGLHGDPAKSLFRSVHTMIPIFRFRPGIPAACHHVTFFRIARKITP
jgi:hypothetical protein